MKEILEAVRSERRTREEAKRQEALAESSLDRGIIELDRVVTALLPTWWWGLGAEQCDPNAREEHRWEISPGILDICYTIMTDLCKDLSPKFTVIRECGKDSSNRLGDYTDATKAVLSLTKRLLSHATPAWILALEEMHSQEDLP